MKNKQRIKPLGRKSYGSIPHLPNSRRGKRDCGCHEGQARIVTEKARDKNDLIIVQEKLDGSNVSVAKIDGKLYPLQRSGYIADTSPFEQHRLFYKFVMKNYERFDEVLEDGERICGEWLAQAHGTRYELKHEPFVAFDIMIDTNRMNFVNMFNRLNGKFTMPHLLHIGKPISVADSLKKLGKYGHHGAIDEVEGLIYRLEKNGNVEFLCKFVKHDKIDGKYLESETGKDAVWNIRKELI